jgi:four helix bundle protein
MYEFRKGQDIADRIFDIGARVMAVVRALPPKHHATKHISSQVVRAATAIGANYEEARAAESRNDFVHKTGLAAKEARETIYWLELVRRSKLTERSLDSLIDETNQIVAILVASRRTASRNKR